MVLTKEEVEAAASALIRQSPDAQFVNVLADSREQQVYIEAARLALIAAASVEPNDEFRMATVEAARETWEQFCIGYDSHTRSVFEEGFERGAVWARKRGVPHGA